MTFLEGRLKHSFTWTAAAGCFRTGPIAQSDPLSEMTGWHGPSNAFEEGIYGDPLSLNLFDPNLGVEINPTSHWTVALRPGPCAPMPIRLGQSEIGTGYGQS